MPDPVTLPTFDTLESIPEPFRPAYEQKDGKYVPKVVSSDEITGLKTKNGDLVKRLSEAQKRAAVIGDRTPEEVQADLDFAAEQRKLEAEKKGRYDDVIKQAGEKHAKEIAAKDKILSERDAEVYDLVGRQAAIEAINAAGGKVKKLLDPVLKNVKVVRGDDGKAVAVVVDAKGNPRIADGQGTPMTIAQLVEVFKADEDYGNDFLASGASGSGARNETGGGKGGAGSAVVLTTEQAKDPVAYRAAKAKAEKLGVPFRVAG